MKNALVAALLACSALTACTGDAEVDTDPAAATGSPAAAPTSAPPSAPATTTTAPAVPDAPPPTTAAFPADTARDVSAASGEPLTVVAVRAARQEGFDRVVFELRGKEGTTGTPGWRVEYVDEARQDGSGDEVEVAGDSILSVFVEGSALPFDSGQEEAAQDLTPRDTDRVREVDLQGTFEGRYTAFIGLDQRVPFRVFRLSDPTRVVVDVRHS